MTLNQAGGFINSAAFAINQKDKLLSISSGQVLTRMHLEGIQNSDFTSGAITTASFSTDSLVGGLQYGASGYGGVTLSGGTTGGASWLTWGDVTRGRDANFAVPGLTPQNVMGVTNRLISVDWRGYFVLPQALDFYGAFGTNPGQTFSFGVNYRWYAEWAT